MGSTYSLSFEATLQNHNYFMNLEKETVVNFQMDKKFPWIKDFGYLHPLLQWRYFLSLLKKGFIQ